MKKFDRGNLGQLFQLLVAAFLVAGLLFRFWHLREIPVALYHDEMDYVMTGESLVRWGTDLTGNWSLWPPRPLKTYNITAEWAAAFHAVAQKIFGLGPDSAHIPAAAFGLATVLLLGGLVWQLTRNKQLAVMAAAVVMVSPWHVYVSRMGYEAVIAGFFQLGFVTALLAARDLPKKLSGRVGLILAALICFLLGYFTYHGAKVTLLTLVPVMLIFLWRQPVKLNRTLLNWKLTVTILVSLLAVVLVGYSWQQKAAGLLGGRENEFVFSADYLATEVNQRRTVMLDLPFSSLVVNKASIFAVAAINRLASAFDVYRLFISGYETGFQFSLAVHGFFYLSALPLLVLGLFATFKLTELKPLKLLLWLIPVGAVASTINIFYQSVFRASLSYLLILLFVAVGLWYLFGWLRASQRPWLTWGLAVLMMAELIWFGYMYFGRYPIVSADNHYFAQKLVGNYLSRTPGQSAHVVVNDNQLSMAKGILGYSRMLDQLTDQDRQRLVADEASAVKFAGVSVGTGCPPETTQLEGLWIVESRMMEQCRLESLLATVSANQSDSPLKLAGQTVALGSPIDSRSYFYLLNDQVCNGYRVPDYVYTKKISDFDVAALTDQQFCETWVKRE